MPSAFRAAASRYLLVRVLEFWVEASKLDRGSPGDARRRCSARSTATACSSRLCSRRHPLRMGFCTQAARSGLSAFTIMRQTGHCSVTVLTPYVREAKLFWDAPASKLVL